MKMGIFSGSSNDDGSSKNLNEETRIINKSGNLLDVTNFEDNRFMINDQSKDELLDD